MPPRAADGRACPAAGKRAARAVVVVGPPDRRASGWQQRYQGLPGGSAGQRRFISCPPWRRAYPRPVAAGSPPVPGNSSRHAAAPWSQQAPGDLDGRRSPAAPGRARRRSHQWPGRSLAAQPQITTRRVPLPDPRTTQRVPLRDLVSPASRAAGEWASRCGQGIEASQAEGKPPSAPDRRPPRPRAQQSYWSASDFRTHHG
jgi:hypothetical protein